MLPIRDNQIRQIGRDDYGTGIFTGTWNCDTPIDALLFYNSPAEASPITADNKNIDTFWN